MKRAALIAVIAVYGFLIMRFVVTSRKSVNRVVESGVKTEGRKAVTAMLQFPPTASPADRSSETIQGMSEAPEPHDLVMPLHSPSDFPELPEDFRKLLISRGCQIPEPYFRQGSLLERPRTVISGEFARSGQTDWAVVCEKDGQSSIVVFWGKPTDCDSELAAAANDDYIEGDGSPTGTIWSFKRSIWPVTSEELPDQRKSDKLSETDPEHYAGGGNWVGSPPPDYTNLSHSAIVDYGRHLQSDSWYCSQRHWYKYNSFGE